MMLWILCLLIFIIIMICILDTNRFVTRRYKIQTNKCNKKIKFVFLSDLHNKSFGKENEKLLEAIKRETPDFVICGGDMPTAHPGADMSKAISLMQKLSKEYQIFYGTGNHEYRLKLYPEKYGSMYQEYMDAIENPNIIFLHNESIRVSNELLIHGLDLERKYYKRFHRNIPTQQVIEDSFKKDIFKEAGYHIMLAHNPEYYDVYKKTKIDLVLSGHLHGGVAKLPILGGVISPSFQLFPKYDGGIFAKGNQKLIVSRGLGCHTIPIRFLNPAELVVVEIN